MTEQAKNPTADFDGKDFVVWGCDDGKEYREFFHAQPDHLELGLADMETYERSRAIVDLYMKGDLGDPFEVRSGRPGTTGVKQCLVCRGDGEILAHDEAAKSPRTMPCPECAMTPEERTEFYATQRIVYWDRAQKKWVEADEWAARQKTA